MAATGLADLRYMRPLRREPRLESSHGHAYFAANTANASRGFKLGRAIVKSSEGADLGLIPINDVATGTEL